MADSFNIKAHIGQQPIVVAHLLEDPFIKSKWLCKSFENTNKFRMGKSISIKSAFFILFYHSSFLFLTPTCTQRSANLGRCQAVEKSRKLEKKIPLNVVKDIRLVSDMTFETFPPFSMDG
jgi:hypothetical protein